MNSNLTAKHYICRDHFAVEQNFLPKSNWTFVGCLSDLSDTNAYITSTIGGKPVVIQRFGDGSLSALSNICRHRLSLLQARKFGVRALTCPYHGWSYDKTGALVGIPCRAQFPELATRDSARNIKLTEYRVEVCGSLVFVADVSVKSSLKEFIGNFYTRLEQLSNAFGRRIDRNELIIKANWKIVVENTLEAYHVATVHENSFAKLGLNTLRNRFDGPHSTMEALLEEKSQRDFEKIAKHFKTRPEIFDGYFHQMVFPAMTFASTGGLSFAVQEIEAIDESTTRFTSHVFLTSYSKTRQSALEEALASTINTFNRQVFEEDRLICTAVHDGTEKSEFGALLGENEARIKEYHRAYIAALSP